MNANQNQTQTSAADVPELQAIVFTSHVLKTFSDHEARLRVLRGVCQYFGLKVAVATPGAAQYVDNSLDVPAFEELVAAAAANSRRFAAPAAQPQMAMAR